MSKSAALEYGFPSTHSTNAVSIASFALLLLKSPESNIAPQLNIALQILSCSYGLSIILGRLYCGMHGFVDVIIGSLIGLLLTVLQFNCGDALDDFAYTGSLKAPMIVILIILGLVRIHPEPADDCPCFDDSVAFAGVLVGIQLGSWHFENSGFSMADSVPAAVPYQLDVLGWPRTVVRIVLGVFLIFAWQEVMKPTLLTLLPPFFRVIEGLGMALPRRFFIRAT